MTVVLKQLLLTGAILLTGVTMSPAQLTVLHSFDGARNDGANPNGSLALTGSILYGATPYGGITNYGTLFKISTDGTGYTNLYHCRATATGGSMPWGSPLVEGTALYGTTSLGGPPVTNSVTILTNSTTLAVTTNIVTSIHGTVFKVDAAGGGFTSLHNFTGQDFGDGSQPWGDLVLGGSALYGCTRFGGNSDSGIIFTVNTNSTGCTILHNFSAGSVPGSSMTLLGDVLYGLTTFGGSKNYGTVFKINTDGTGYTVLYNFRGAPWDGSHPQGSLLFSAGMLYGMTPFGGTNGFGTLFQISTNGTGYTSLYHFTGAVTNGANPYGSLALSGGTLYGMTTYGGSSNAGTLFKISTNGSGFQILRNFTGGENDGANPYGSLTPDGTALYGMTSQGGTANEGVLFAFLLSAADSDSDGIPDEWETQYFGGATNANPSAPAANGVNTIYETYIAGLNPTNPASVFLISDIRPLTSASTLQWQSVSGRVYSVYWTTNLMNSFQSLETNIVWPQSSWTDLVHGAQEVGFYRIKVRLPQ
jgi:uncharacterized repeat protein (TIGR03803 family)